VILKCYTSQFITVKSQRLGPNKTSENWQRERHEADKKGVYEMLEKVLTLEEKLNPKHTAVLVVDVQNDFCHPDGHFANSGVDGFCDISMASPMKANLVPFLDAAHKSLAMVVFIKAIYDTIYVSAPCAEKFVEMGFYGKACLSGTWGAEYWEGICPTGMPREIEVIKHRYSAFQGTDLDLILRSNEVKTLIMTGVATSGCVDSTARDGFFRDYYIILASDCMADFTLEKHEMAIIKLNSTFGHIVQSSEIIRIWNITAKKS
jgi:ureidoacrylate peracid hydrolase